MQARDTRKPFRHAMVLVAFAVPAIVPSGALAHGDDRAATRLNFDRPEAWALKYFASATLPAGLGAPRTRRPWSVSFGLELGWLTPVSDADRFVGFDGTKQEDLNKAPFFARPRLTVGLPARLALTVAGQPPIRTFGVRPALLAVAVERPVYEGERWSVGLRGYGQVGHVEGAYTCPASVLAFEAGSPANLYGCEAQSSDVATLRFAGAEVLAAYQPAGRRLSFHGGIGVNVMDLAFEVNALTFGFEDRTHYLARGTTVSGSAGIGYALGRRMTAAVDVFYTPLPVERAGRTRDAPFFNLRALLSYSLR